MATITIMDRHTYQGPGVYVGRPRTGKTSLLGNPFHMKEDGSNRAEVCAKYLIWLREQYRKGGAVKAELLRLARLYKDGQDIILICWCAPKQCHAEHIRDAIIKIAATL